MCEKIYKRNLNLNYFPTNFVEKTIFFIILIMDVDNIQMIGILKIMAFIFMQINLV